MLLLLTLLTAAAQSDEARAAEHVRLSETMRKLSGRNAWEGVDRSYRELVAMGITPTYDDHYMGAQAAWAIGDADSTRQRLERALAVKSDDEVKRWLAEIHNNYNPVQLSGTGPLVIAESPFAADQRAALAFAEAKLTEQGSFSGMLPNGSYTFDGQAFELFPGCPPVSLGRTSRQRAPRQRASGQGDGISLGPVRPTASAGLAVTRAGSPRQSGIQPAGFIGPGVRLGLGPELAIGDALGLKLEVGYQGLITAASQLHRGHLWLGASWAPTDALWLHAGPEVGIGRARTTGLDQDSYDAYCAENPEDSRCGWVDRTALPGVEVVGTVRSAGLTVGLSRPGRTLGRMSSGLALLGGVSTDTLRLYPWAQLALTFRGE